MSNTQHTPPGPVKVYMPDYDTSFRPVVEIGDFRFTVQDANDGSTPEGNAKLIAETFNVATETGLTPRQLADQRAELLGALVELEADIMVLGRCDKNDPAHDEWEQVKAAQRRARAAIAKAKGE